MKYDVKMNAEEFFYSESNRMEHSSHNMKGYKALVVSEPKSANFWRDVIVEVIATFFLVSVQSAIPLTWGGNVGGPVQTGLTMGFIVCTMANTFGDFSGGHMNPAVTLSMAMSAQITFVRAIFYVIAQCVGGILGTGFVYLVTPEQHRGKLSLTTVNKEMNSFQGICVEAWITGILVLTILGAVNSRRKPAGLFMPTIPIGFAIALGIMTGWSYTGGSMNPARSLGPAVITGDFTTHYVYWIGPLAGSAIVTVIYSFILNRIGMPDKSETFNVEMR